MTDNLKTAKHGYNQPKLTSYGGFADLTASGSGSNIEGGSGNNPNRRP